MDGNILIFPYILGFTQRLYIFKFEDIAKLRTFSAWHDFLAINLINYVVNMDNGIK